MKKNLILTGIILATVVLAVLSVVTAIRIKNLGTQPVAPSAPASKPKAVVPTSTIGNITPATGCVFNFSVATPTPCPVKIQGRVYRDRSLQADYRVSDTEEFGPVVFRVDYQPDGQNMIINGGNKACVDSCSPSCAVNFANGSFATGSLNSGKYAVRLYLNSADWVVTEAYLSNGTACKANKAGNVAVSGLNTQIGYISSTDYSCGTYNIWFGVKPKAEATGTPTPTSTSTPTGTLTPTPTGTQAPTPTNTPIPTATNTPSPGGESYCDYLRADKTSGSVSLSVNFTGKGYDTTRVKGFRFTYGDGKNQEFLGSFTSDHVQQVSHTYDKVGTYQAYLEILDNGDRWKTRNECKLTITVSGFAQGPTSTPVYRAAVEPTPTETLLPEAGLKIPTFGGLIMGFLLIALGAALVF